MSVAQAQVSNDISKLYQEKKYLEVIKKFENNKNELLENETSVVQVIDACEKLNLFDSALTIGFSYVNKNYPGEVTRLLRSVRKNEEVKNNDYSRGLKNSILRIFNGFSVKILNSESKKEISDKDFSSLEQYKKLLEKLGYEMVEVNKTYHEIESHIKDFEELTYHWNIRVFIDYLSWQTSATLRGPFEQTPLLATNVGFCPGVGFSFENRDWSYSSDLSFLYGSGGVSSTQGLVDYQQSSVPAIGGKFSLGAGRIVSTSRSELGLKFTLLYVRQSLNTPSSAGYSVDQPNALGKAISIYSRWGFGRFYLITEFGRYVPKPATLWALGLGFTL